MMSLDMKCRGLIALALNCWIYMLARPVSRYGQIGACIHEAMRASRKSLSTNPFRAAMVLFRDDAFRPILGGSPS